MEEVESLQDSALLAENKSLLRFVQLGLWAMGLTLSVCPSVFPSVCRVGGEAEHHVWGGREPGKEGQQC